MVEARLTIVNDSGLHMRAGKELVKTAARFRSRVMLAREDVEVDGKSIMGVLMLAAEKGAELTIRVEGEDECAALEAIRALVEAKFGEE